MSIKQLSVFFPCFNEEGSISQTVQKAIKVLEERKIGYEILIINDGSTDNTAEVAEELAKKNSKIKVIHHPQNLGYGEALKSGFYNAKFDTIVYTDGDGQFDFSEVDKFLEKIKDFDLVLGYRIKRQDPFFRILFKKGWKLSLLLSFGLTIRDVDCGFKMIKKSVLTKIPHLESTRGAMINAELAIKTGKYGFRVGQVGVNHYPRLSGKPTGASLQVIIKSYLDLLKLWWKLKDQKPLFVILCMILVLAGFFRFFRIEQYMTFLGDEGRDAIIVKGIINFENWPLIGPPTSLGNIYLAPLYYYMMAVPMAIFSLNPASAAGMNALVGVLTVGLVYYLGKLWFGRVAGLISAFLYAISPVTIIYSKSSWNPNPTPFFTLLAILGSYKAHSSGNYRWLILTGIATAAAIQMHYLALILIPIFIVGWFKEFFRKNIQKRFFWNGTIFAVLCFFLLMSPLLIFDLKHDFLNFKAVTTLLLSKDGIGFNLFESLNKIPSLYSNNLVGRYLTGENSLLTPLVSILILFPVIWTGYLIYKKRPFNYGLWILNSWFLIGILGLSLLNTSIYDHYLGFLNPVPFLLFGALVNFKTFGGKIGLWIVVGGMFFLLTTVTLVNISRNPLFSPPNNQLERTQNIARFIIRESGGQDFNFALLAERNYDSAYQFYLEQYGHKAKKLPFEKTSQLFVVCEEPLCQPIYSPKYEIAAFGWTSVEKIWEVEGLAVYKLVQNPNQFR